MAMVRNELKENGVYSNVKTGGKVVASRIGQNYLDTTSVVNGKLVGGARPVKIESFLKKYRVAL